MSASLETFGLGDLSVNDRIALVQLIWDSIADDVGKIPLTLAQQQELERRADDDDANPGDRVSWEDVRAEALNLFKPIQTQNHF